MPENETKGPDASGNKPPPANLYHKERRAPRTRLQDDPSQKVLPNVEIGGPPRRRQSSHNPFRTVVKASLKKLALVVGLMALLLIAAVKLIGQFSSRDHNRARATPPKAPLSTNRVDIGQILPSGRAARDTNSVRPTSAALDTEALRKAAYLAKKAKNFEDSGELAKAVETYREALEVWPYTPAVWAQLGRVYLRQKDYWHGQIALEKAAEGDPGSAAVFNDLGVAYLVQQKFDRAMTMFLAATDIDPNYVPTYFNKSLCFIGLNDRAKARDALEQFLRMSPDDARGLREIACMKALDGKREEALLDLEHAIAQAPDWCLLYLDSAAIASLLGQFDKAIRYLEKAEPCAGPAPVYKLYQEPAFAELRLSEMGKLFERELAARARELLARQEATHAMTTNAPSVPTASDPIISTPK